MSRMRLRDPKGIQDLRELSLVEVTWWDAASDSHWKTFEDVRAQGDEGLIECQTVGYLVKVSKKTITLAQTRSKMGKVSCDWSIPRPWIIKVVRK